MSEHVHHVDLSPDELELIAAHRRTQIGGDGVPVVPRPVRYVSALTRPDLVLRSRDLVLCGLAAPFFTRGPAPAGGGEIAFRPGAFLKAIRSQPIAFRINHTSTSFTIASTTDQSLQCWESGDGLMFAMTPDTEAGRVVLAHAQRGAYGACSISLRVATSEFLDQDGVRAFHVADLDEVSVLPTSAPPRFAGTWLRVMTRADADRLRAAAYTDVAMTHSRTVVYGGERWHYPAGQTYRVPAFLARVFVSGGWAMTARREI